MLAAVTILPIVLLTVYFVKRDQWQNKDFKERVGTMLEGINKKWSSNKWQVLFFPLMFFVRRQAFVLTAVFWYSFFWGQICLLYAMSTALIMFLQWSKPLESKFANFIETFNECFMLFVFYFLMCFTDFVPYPKDRDLIGKGHISLIMTFICFHLLILLAGIFKNSKLVVKKRYAKCKSKKTNNAATNDSTQIEVKTQVLALQQPAEGSNLAKIWA